MKHIKFPKIKQFKDAIKEVKSMSEFVGLDENGDAIFDHDLKKPTINFKGCVKIHGTNAGIQYNCETGELVAQSRSQIVRDGHFGFPQWVNQHRKNLIALCEEIKSCNNTESVVLFGEWAGRGIQKGVGICNIDPAFFLFDVGYMEDDIVWDCPIIYTDYFYTIENFQTYQVDVDFNNPAEARDKMEKMVEEVENNCPVAAAFGVSGIGEGIVFTGTYKDRRIRFKVKGEAHKVVGSKDKIAITEEDLRNVQDLVNYTVTENRVKQGIQEVCNGELDKKYTGALLKWIVKDIQSEEQDAIDKLGVNGYTKYLSDAARKIYFEMIDEEIV